MKAVQIDDYGGVEVLDVREVERPRPVRELRARERGLCGLHRLDRTLHAFWARLPLRQLRIAGTVAILGIAVYLVVARRGSIEHALSRLGRAQPGWIAVSVAAELSSLVCYVE